jgi:hypothetical protein
VSQVHVTGRGSAGLPPGCWILSGGVLCLALAPVWPPLLLGVLLAIVLLSLLGRGISS